MEKKTVTIEIELTHDLYHQLARRMGKSKRRMANWIVKQVKSRNGPRKSKKLPRTGVSPQLEKFFGAFKGGDPKGSDNRKIDADIERAINEDFERGKR